jgi:tetratricopeptide (TPR) repeat protein
MFEVSEKILDLLIHQKSSTKYKLELARILLNKRDYEKVIEITDEITTVEKNNYGAWVLRGNAFYFKNDLYNSEESYVRAIRCKSDRNERFDIKMLYRLGMTYINRTTWKDAKTVFLQILKENPGYSFAWGYLGFSLMKLGEYQSAEEALNEANLLDVENPTIWAYLCIFCILVGRKSQAYECLNELMKMKMDDVKLLEEIADLLSKNGDLSLTCDIYNKILALQPNNVKILFKLATIYSQIESKKGEGLELLKNKLKVTVDDNDKKKIVKFIEYLNKEVGFTPGKDINFSTNSDHQSGVNEDEIKNAGTDTISVGDDNILDHI